MVLSALTVKNRLALQFTLLFAVLLAVALTGIYVFIKQYREQAFFKRLDDRALTVAEFYLAEDNLTSQQFKQVKHKYSHSLPHENLSVYNKQLQPWIKAQHPIQWPKEFLEDVRRHRKAKRTDGLRQATGILYHDNSGDFVFVVSAEDDTGYTTMQELRIIMISVFVVLLGITFVLGRMFAHFALRPIVSIRNELGAIKAVNLNRRLEVSDEKADEIDSLCVSINQLLEHLEQSFESQKFFVANSSHELRTPLTSILGQAETTLARDRSAEDYKATLQGIIESVVQLNHIINSLMELAETNMDIKDFQVIKADELAWEVTDEFMLRNSAEALSVEYRLSEVPQHSLIYGNRRLLFLAIHNLLKNAKKFSNGQTVTFKLTTGNAGATIVVEDQGIGIDPADLKNIFRPFFRGANGMQYPGSGIGLSLTHNIMKLHNAEIVVESEMGAGTRVSLHFPPYSASN